MHGFLVLDKPPGITSRDVVDRVEKWFPRKTKMGHGGTLDPIATGVLVIGVGQATRLIEYVQSMPKCYRTRIAFGATSDTDDADGNLQPNSAAKPVDESALRRAIASFVGEIDQIPPAYSAVLVDGKRAHALARKGREVSLAPRRVRIDRIDVCRYEWPAVDLEVHCGKGTYIRSIARDLGKALDVGGYVADLCRTQIGPFLVENAIGIDADRASIRLLPLQMALGGIRTIVVTQDEIERIRHGNYIITTGIEGETVAIDLAGELIAVGRIAVGKYWPDKVMMT